MADTPDFVIWRSDALDAVPHGFFGHAAGAHQFGYGGPGDTDQVHRLRADGAQLIAAGGALAAPHQVHSPDVITLSEAWEDQPEGRPVADALVTDQTGIVLGIVTADCAPVLFADREAKVIGAAHAGWRGAQGGVLENTVAAMETLGASRKNIAAAIGPTIAQASYEVDSGFRDHFQPGDNCHFADAPARDGKARWLFDLPGYVTAQLGRAGVTMVDDLACDTYAMAKEFYSFRRATHNTAPNYGRQIAMIALG